VIITEIVEGRIRKLAAESSGGVALGADVDVYREVLEDQSLQQGWVKGCEDLAALSHCSPMQQALYEEGVCSYVVVPLFIQDELIGALHLEAVRPRAFTAEHVDTATEIAILLAVGIRQARLYERAQREIAEREQAQAALHQRTLELEDQNAELDAFAHTVAHDLKNPLSSVMGYASLLTELSKYEGPVRQENLDLVALQIIEGAEIMDRIVESLMLLAGVRKQDVVSKPLDMAGIMTKVQRSLASLIEGHQAEIILPDSWPTALGYGPWVEVVWSNYIGNAIKYGGHPPRVEVGATVLPPSIPSAGGEGKGGMVRFWVRDNGQGLSFGEQARLFAPFERLSQIHVGGHGFGLSIVRRIIDKLGGEVGVESEVGQGSEFWFSLRGVQQGRGIDVQSDRRRRVFSTYITRDGSESMSIHDISLSISESLVVWPGDPPVSVTQVSHLDKGDHATVSRLEMGAHTGTHVDAPAHFVRGGAGVDMLDLNTLVGLALVSEARAADALTADVLAELAIPLGAERVLFRTRNSNLWAQGECGFDEGFVAITEDGARWLIERGIRLVGVDYLSVGPFSAPRPTHEMLLQAGVVLVEGLDLSGIRPGMYQFVCLPLKIEGADGAPARAILMD
jgi:arylformamidase